MVTQFIPRGGLTIGSGPDTDPDPTTATGVGLLMYHGLLSSMSHLTDGTYDLVIAAWEDQATLATVSGEAYAYTVNAGTPGADPDEFTVLDPDDPTAYLALVSTLPAGVGVFLDNTLSTIDGLLEALAVVKAGLVVQGRKICVNAGSFVDGDSGSDTGTLWQAWAADLVPVTDRILLEHWQQVPSLSEQLRTRGTSHFYEHWDTWQDSPAAAEGKFVGLTYDTLEKAIYCRASMLTAPGASGTDVFIFNNGDGETTGTTDAYDEAWATLTPDAVVDPVAGTATL